MRNSEEYSEAFEMTEADYEYAMDPSARPRRRQTKEDAIYGSFLDSDDDEDRPSSSKQSFSKKPNYAAPVKFISGGVKKGNKIEKEEGAMEDKDVEFIPIGRSAARQSGSQSARRSRNNQEQSGFTRPEAGAQVLAGMRSSPFQATGVGDTSNVSWAASSGNSAVVMKMMQSMGYVQGKGLGANKQGIVEPVQAKVRPGRAAIGGYGSEAQGPRFGESAAEAQSRISGNVDEPSPDDARSGGKKENWKKTNATKKQKVHYKSLDEIVEEGNLRRYDQVGAGLGVKIIDMTGPEQKVYNDFSSFSRRARAPNQEGDRTKFDVPELGFNLNTLMDITEEEIVRNDRELRFLKDQTTVLHEDQKKLQKQVDEEREEVTRMQEVIDLVQRFENSSALNGATLEECRDLFLLLRSEYAVEYKLFGLDLIAIAKVLPTIKEYFSNWDPLDPEQQTHGMDILREWKGILGESKSASTPGGHFKKDSNSLSAYDTCVWESWMPNVRRAAQLWSPSDNSVPMLNLVAIWLTFLPHWIGENLLEQVIIPRIAERVEIWDPVVDRVPIDEWLLPWQPVMGDRLLLVYPVIRQKLAKGLKNWIPGDRSAIASIRPWKNIFASGTMGTFLGYNIVPKLERALQAIDINTVEQFKYLELFDWAGLISTEIICQMMIKHFFPRFYESLCIRLMVPNVSLIAVQTYYKEWKNLLPDAFLAMKPIREELTRALMAINQVQKGLTLNPMPTSYQPMMNNTPSPASQFFMR